MSIALQKDRMARDCSLELAKYGVAFVSVWPGPVRTESVMNKSDEFLAKPEVVMLSVALVLIVN